MSNKNDVLFEDEALPTVRMRGLFPLSYEQGAEIATRRHLRDISDYLSDIRWFCFIMAVELGLVVFSFGLLLLERS